MAASSPYTQNDYQASSNFRPYQLPVNDVANAVAAENQFWDAGARRVKSVYDNAINLALTSDENKDVRDQFMQDAEKQIVKVSSMNLADPSVQRQGFGIFKPLYKDDAIVQDDYLTNLQSSIIGEANRYKSDMKTKGAGYSNTNLGFALDGFQQFNSKTPRDKMGQLYSNLKGKEYEPYYDYSKEFAEIVKGCKGPTTQAPEAGTDYLLYQSGASDTRLQGCLSSTLSDKAKRQIEIEGHMAFKNSDGSINYGGLSDAYASKFSTLSGELKTNSDTIQARITALEQEYTKSPTPEMKAQIDMEKSLLDQNTARYNNLVTTQKSINTGDRAFVDRNYSTLAGSVYRDSVVDAYSESYRNDVYKYVPDAVKLQADRFTFTQQENALDRQQKEDLENLRYQHDAQIEAMKIGKKLTKNADGTYDYQTINAPYRDTNIQKNGYQQWQTKYAQVKQEGIDELKNFYNTYVADDWKAKGKTQAQFFDEKTGAMTPAAMEYMKAKDVNNSEDLLQFYNRVMPINAETKVMEAEDRVNQERLKRENPELFNRGFLQAIDRDYKPITIGSTTIGAADIQDAMEGKSNKIKIVKGQPQSVTSPTGPSASGDITLSSYDYTPEKIYVNNNGQWREVSGKEIRSSDLNRMEQRVLSGNTANIKAINEKQNDLYGNALLVQKNRLFATERNIDKNENQADDDVRQRVFAYAKQAGAMNIKPSDIQYEWVDPQTGEAEIRITGSTTNASTPSTTKLMKTINDTMAADKTEGAHIYGNTISVTIKDPSLIDQKLTSNPYLRTENAIRGMETAINPSSMPAGLRMDAEDVGSKKHDYSVVIASPIDNFNSYKIVPFKDVDGTVKWDVQARWAGKPTDTYKTGQYYIMNLGNRRSARGLPLDQVISLINGYDPSNARQ